MTDTSLRPIDGNGHTPDESDEVFTYGAARALRREAHQHLDRMFDWLEAGSVAGEQRPYAAYEQAVIQFINGAPFKVILTCLYKHTPDRPYTERKCVGADGLLGMPKPIFVPVWVEGKS